MPDNLIGEIRRSAVVMSFAPGAIMDMRADGGPVSVVSAGLEEWDFSAPLTGNLKYQKIIERRLCKKLGKRYFRLPPVLEENAKIPFTDDPDPSALVARRFPEWLQCPKCEVLRPNSKWASEPGRAYRYCPSCTQAQPGGKKVFAVPVRFATACLKGHLDDFPWNFWVRHKPDCRNRDHLVLTSVGAGLAGLYVKCPKCGEGRSMDGAFRKSALSGLKCEGKRPWLRSNDSACDCTGDDGTYRVVQRGASNLYYPVLESALDIPPWTRKLERMLGDYWDYLAETPLREDRIRLFSTNTALEQLVDRENLKAETVVDAFEVMEKNLGETNPADIRPDEYRIFSSGLIEQDQEFEIYPEAVPEYLQSCFAKIVRVERLREVRVIRGFTRINPPFDPDGADIAPISVSPLDWLPAIEVRGEGIFLQLNLETLLAWENRPTIVQRCKDLDASWTVEWESRNPDKPKPYIASPRLLLIHTLAHVLIRQLTLECGYSSASLRERLYVSEGNDGMAGILIYTSTPDSDGTLGGLQRRAMPDLFGPTVTGAIRSSHWCSSDPLCINGEMAAPESHSNASCHSCTMVPETSCELHNRFLDRALLVGLDTTPEIGFMRILLNPGG